MNTYDLIGSTVKGMTSLPTMQRISVHSSCICLQSKQCICPYLLHENFVYSPSWRFGKFSGDRIRGGFTCALVEHTLAGQSQRCLVVRVSATAFLHMTPVGYPSCHLQWAVVVQPLGQSSAGP